MDCAVDGEDDGFEGNHAADLSPLDAGGAEDSDFAGAFADGEEQCVDDSQDCDDHCQGEQSVDDAEQLVDLGAEASAEFIFGFHLDDEEGGYGVDEDVAEFFVGGGAVAVDEDLGPVVGVRGGEDSVGGGCVDHEVSDEVGFCVDAGDGDADAVVGSVGVDGDGVAYFEVGLVGVGGGDHDAGGFVVEGVAGADCEVEELREVAVENCGVFVVPSVDLDAAGHEGAHFADSAGLCDFLCDGCGHGQ